MNKFNFSGMRINSNGTTIKDRKPHLKLCPNHYRYMPKIKRAWFSNQQGTAINDGKDWYKKVY